MNHCLQCEREVPDAMLFCEQCSQHRIDPLAVPGFSAEARPPATTAATVTAAAAERQSPPARASVSGRELLMIAVAFVVALGILIVVHEYGGSGPCRTGQTCGRAAQVERLQPAVDRRRAARRGVRAVVQQRGAPLAAARRAPDPRGPLHLETFRGIRLHRIGRANRAAGREARCAHPFRRRSGVERAVAGLGRPRRAVRARRGGTRRAASRGPYAAVRVHAAQRASRCRRLARSLRAPVEPVRTAEVGLHG